MSLFAAIGPTVTAKVALTIDERTVTIEFDKVLCDDLGRIVEVVARELAPRLSLRGILDIRDRDSDTPAAADDDDPEPAADTATADVTPITRRNPPIPDDGDFVCGECGKTCSGKHGLQVHVARTHGPNAPARKKKTASTPTVDADPARAVVLLRCATEDCDYAAVPKDVQKFRSHIRVEHGRDPARDELTPRLEHHESSGGGGSASDAS